MYGQAPYSGKDMYGQTPYSGGGYPGHQMGQYGQNMNPHSMRGNNPQQFMNPLNQRNNNAPYPGQRNSYGGNFHGNNLQSPYGRQTMGGKENFGSPLGVSRLGADPNGFNPKMSLNGSNLFPRDTSPKSNKLPIANENGMNSYGIAPAPG